MGINHQCLSLLEGLTDWTGKTVIEFGDQCIVPPLAGLHVARNWYLSKGAAKYIALDLNGSRGAMQRDVRGDLSDLGRFDVVTNFGTLEHLDNGVHGQAAGFRNMHELCKVGGLIVQDIPLEAHYRGHSPVLYTPQFLAALYDRNQYEWIGPRDRVTNACHTAILRKLSDDLFIFPHQATQELLHYPNEGVAGMFVCN